MRFLRQSTATAILVGPFLDDTDGKTPETALDVTTMDVDLYKHDNTHPLTKTDITPAASSTTHDAAHVANGFYSLELTATDTNTLGRCMLTINVSGALPVSHEFMVIPGPVWDWFFGTGNDLRIAMAALVNTRSIDQQTNRTTIKDNDGITTLAQFEVSASGTQALQLDITRL